MQERMQERNSSEIAMFVYEMGETVLKLDDDKDTALLCFDQLLQLVIQPAHTDYASLGDFLASLASLFHERGHKKKSLECLERCAVIHEQHYGNDSVQLGDTYYLMGRVCMEIEDRAGAARYLNDALRIREDVGEAASEIHSQLESLAGKGIVSISVDEGSINEHSLESALDGAVDKDGNGAFNRLRVAELSQYHADEFQDGNIEQNPVESIANFIEDAGQILSEEGMDQEADECYGFSSDIRNGLVIETDIELVNFLHGIGEVLLEIEDFPMATDIFEEEKLLRTEYFPADAALVVSLHALGSLLLNVGDHERSLATFLEEIDVRKELDGPDNLDVANTLDIVGALYLENGDHSAALDCFSEVARIQKIHLGEEHENVAETLYSIGLILLSLTDHQEALYAFRQVVGIRQKTRGRQDTSVGDALNISGFLEAKCGNKEQALRFLTKALGIRKQNREYVKAADTLQQIGDIHREYQAFDLAVDCYKECLKLNTLELGDEDEEVVDGYIALGNIQAAVGKHSDAGTSYQAGYLIISKVSGEDDERLMPLLLKMGAARLKAGELEQAEQDLQQFTQVRKEDASVDDIDYVNALRLIGQIRCSQGDIEGGMKFWEEAFDKYTENQLAYDHPSVGEKLRNLLDDGEETISTREQSEGGAFFKLFERPSSAQPGQVAQGNPSDDDENDTFFSTQMLDLKQFSTSTKSLRSSIRDGTSVKAGSRAGTYDRSLMDSYDEQSLIRSHAAGKASRVS